MPTTTNPSARGSLLCPSSQPEVEGARVLGVVEHTSDGHRLQYLDEPLKANAEVLAMAGEVNPSEVFRLAATCQTGNCPHFDGSSCGLATRIVQIMPAVVDSLPRCQIRRDCRWFQQEGAAACRRCPQVTSLNYNPSAMLQSVVNPGSASSL